MGIHSTNDLDDGYFGSGKRLLRSLQKHGRSNHIRVIVEMFSDRASLVEREKCLIGEQMLIDPTCMNLAPGGEGGITLAGELLERHRVQNRGVNNPFFGKHHTENALTNIGKAQKGNKHGKGLFPSVDVRAKRSKSMKLAWTNSDVQCRMKKSRLGSRSKLTSQQVEGALELLKSGVMLKIIASIYEVGIAVIRRIAKGTYVVKREN